MADEARRKRGHTGNERMSAGTQVMLIIVVLVITLVLVYLLQTSMGLDTATAIIVGSLLVVAVGFLLTWLLIRYRKHRIYLDGRSTVDPIMDRFAKSHNATQLLAEYDQWRTKDHDPQLVFIFTRATVEALIDTRNFKQARRQLKLMGEMPSSPRARVEFQQFREDCEKRMGKGPSRP